jgi:hypothetical protein
MDDELDSLHNILNLKLEFFLKYKPDWINSIQQLNFKMNQVSPP